VTASRNNVQGRKEKIKFGKVIEYTTGTRNLKSTNVLIQIDNMKFTIQENNLV
jgi:hypothetical protein